MTDKKKLKKIAELVMTHTKNRRDYKVWETKVMSLCGYELNEANYFIKKEEDA